MTYRAADDCCEEEQEPDREVGGASASYRHSWRNPSVACAVVVDEAAAVVVDKEIVVGLRWAVAADAGDKSRQADRSSSKDDCEFQSVH